MFSGVLNDVDKTNCRTMTKKKANRPKHQKDVSLGDTSEEECNALNAQGKSCQHVGRGIHFGRVKKSLKSSQSITKCTGCSNENTDEEQPEVWLCLQCGYKGCGRMSENKHALQHFKTLHSDCHSLVLSTTSGSVWCYDCDDEVSLQSSRVLKQCVEFVMKMSSDATNKSNVQNVNRLVAQQNLQNSVIKEESSVQNPEEKIPAEKTPKPVKNNKESSQKILIKGLRNLGNTCFFNAVMQNLNQTTLLHHELKNTCTPSHLWQLPELVVTNNEIAEVDDAFVKLSLPRQFPLTNSFLNFLEQMQAITSSKTDIVNPAPLFGEISKKCPQFRHFQQQDSHELLRQLLDGVRQEEIKRQKKAILRHFDLENVSPEEVDEELKKQIKAYGCYASHTIIEKVFGGLLISTVLCEECKGSSQVFEPFMDLSLPLFEEKQENNAELYGMLDGGKQDHIKPLRNTKTDWDSDENAQGYVISKPKNDVAKPSKHQEKKQKQLAKREKKRAAKSFRSGKSSLNENCNKENESHEAEDREKDDDEEEEENSKDFEQSTNADYQEEETWEVPGLFSENEEDDGQILEASPSKQENAYEVEELSVESHAAEESKADINGTDTISCQTEEKMDVEFSSKEPSEVKLDSDKNESPVHKQIESDEFCPLSAAVQNSSKDQGDSMPLNCDEFQDEKYVQECSGKQLKEIGDNSTDCFAKQTEADVDIQCDDIETKNLVDSNIKDIQKQEEEQNDIAVDSIDNIVGDVKELESNVEKAEVADDSLCSLADSFNNCVKIDSNPCNIDDRIQALSMQVKDVRIRRDSDRQENLLNSSESAEDWESQKTNCTSPKSSIEDSCSVENGDNWSHSVSEQQTKDWISKTLTTLKARHHVSPLECSINSCLSHFTKPELLTGNNKFRCENCTQLKIKKTGNKKDVVYSNASKQMLIFSPPAVLTLHLKRFQQVGMSLRKVNRFVEFPLILDLAPYCCSACSILPHMSSVEDEILYSLYGIVEHSGRLTSGHYTAYVKSNKRTINTIFECQLPLAQCDLEQLLRKFIDSNKASSQNKTAENIKEDSQWFYISDSHVREASEAQVLKCQAYLLFYERIK